MNEVEKYKKKKIKEFKELGFILPDGFYENCLVYHEAAELFISETIDEIIGYMPEDCCDKFLENLKKLIN